MFIRGVSSFSATLESQDTLRQSRLSLEEAQTELSTGRFADVNLKLGANVTRNIDWRVALSESTQFIDAANQTNDKANASQAVLESIKNSASTFLNALTGSRSAINGQGLAKSTAGQQIASFEQAMNTEYAGQFLFGGLNSSNPPLKTYQGGPAQAAFDSAFQAQFGFAKTDPQAANITPAQMTQFLQTTYDNLFQSPAWNTNQSNAADQNVKTRIDASQLVDASANANESAFKDVMKAMVAVMDAGTGQLNQSTFQTVIDYAMTKVANSVQGIGEIEARIGSVQQTITTASDKHQSVKSILEKQIQDTESVDSADASVRVNALMNQLEANYAVTGKISKLSLLTYI
jgi:flagellar hook-associated protein 3 FlgL